MIFELTLLNKQTTGGTKYVHMRCLIKWVETGTGNGDRSRCSICKTRLVI